MFIRCKALLELCIQPKAMNALMRLSVVTAAAASETLPTTVSHIVVGPISPALVKAKSPRPSGQLPTVGFCPILTWAAFASFGGRAQQAGRHHQGAPVTSAACVGAAPEINADQSTSLAARIAAEIARTRPLRVPPDRPGPVRAGGPHISSIYRRKFSSLPLSSEPLT
jgi:hypothetical protein